MLRLDLLAGCCKEVCPKLMDNSVDYSVLSTMYSANRQALSYRIHVKATWKFTIK
ncbi:hypothetical protein SBF1_7280002 [Candidatus Desulfosporosinus infrequens]|uniref:Uncharacterized protein n=1 Tax=Candidatus Desulfosporosinus infrequens TaxID=2043169 RepID=A0A2U3LQE6_9FIRM|nr:hypothetical protein SBF1_7280002 [Candidatus Desulfosporosinus infrequens]